jgi:hypothetical protein
MLTTRRCSPAGRTLVRNIRLDKQQGIVLPSDTDSKGKLLYEFSSWQSPAAAPSTPPRSLTATTSRLPPRCSPTSSSSASRAHGSFALSSDKTALFATAIGGFLKASPSVFNRHLLPRLWELNASIPR